MAERKAKKPTRGKSSTKVKAEARASTSQKTNTDVETSVCSICLEDTQEKLQCGHFVHMSCAKKHFKPECPVCRIPLNITVTGEYPETEDLTTDRMIDYYATEGLSEDPFGQDEYKLPENEHLEILRLLQEFRQGQNRVEVVINHGGGIFERRIIENGQIIYED